MNSFYTFADTAGMESGERRSGLPGLTGLFRESVADLPDGSRIAFTGSVGGCLPIAELLALAVRKRGFQLSFVPLADPAEARPMRWSEGVGFTVGAEKMMLQQADALVVLGGLAMPKIGRPVEDVESLHRQLGSPRLIGVGFMGVLERMGWTKRLPFDALIDGHIDAAMWSKER